MSQVLRLSIIGLGHRAAAVLVALKRIGTAVQVCGYYDPKPEGIARLVEEGIDTGVAFASAAEAAQPDGPDLIVIGSPNHLHLEHLQTAVKAGVPVFLEKPVVRTPVESMEVARILTLQGSPPVYVGLVLRSAPIVKNILSIVESGDLGRVVSIDATEHLPPEHGAYLARNWRRKRAWGGSFLLDKVCHDFDILNAVAGARPARAASFGGRSFFADNQPGNHWTYSTGERAFGMWPGGWAAHPEAFSSDVDVTDHQTALIEYENGVQLSFHSNSMTALRERRWYIAGDRGTLVADLVRNTITWRQLMDIRAPQKLAFDTSGDDHNGADLAMARDLVAALSGSAAFPVNPKLAIEAGLTVMLIDEAYDSRQIVNCTPTWNQLDQIMPSVRVRNK